MKTTLSFQATVALAALLLLSAAQAALTGKADYKTDKALISANFKSVRTACDSMAGNRKDICVEEAKAKEKTARAELEFAHTGSFRDKNRVAVAAAESVYAVAKEKCDEQSGHAKDVCVTQAKAIEAKALADVKMSKKINAAVRDDVETRLNAVYRIAI